MKLFLDEKLKPEYNNKTMKDPYPPEITPENIKYVSDNPANRKLLTEKLGEPKWPHKWYTYLEIDTTEKTWRSCFMYEWMYRNPPELSNINDVV